MHSSFLERVFGYRPTTATPKNVSVSSANAELESGMSASAAPRLSTNDSTQYRATTRPYHCSQNQMSGVCGRIRGDTDGAASFALGRFGNDTAMAALPLTYSSPASTSANKSPKLVFALSRSNERGSAPPKSFHLTKLPTDSISAPATGLDALSTVSTTSVLTATSTTTATSAAHLQRFEAALRADPADVAKLRELSWQGCPVKLRYEVWMFLTGCWSPPAATRMSTLSRRCMEYATYIHSSYGIVDWDAVCALVDSGVDTAVRRSTLKSVDAATAAAAASTTSFLSANTPVREIPVPDLVMTTSASRMPSQVTPLTPVLPSGKCSEDRVVTGEGDLLLSLNRPDTASSSSLRPPYSSPYALQRSSVSLEDVRSLLAQPPNPATTVTTTAATAVVSLEASGVLADTSFNSVNAATTHVTASPMQFAGSDSRTLSTPTRNLPTPTTTTLTATNTNINATGHQLSASTMLGSKELQTLKQIRKDIPRMSGGRCYLLHPRVQGSIERILFTWSLRHPACGYVQGMNDLVVPFMGVVLAYHFCPTRSITELHSYTEDILEEIWSLEAVPVAQWINEIEAEVFWFTSYLLNTMQDNYTSSHAGITTMMRHLAAVVQAADPTLYHCMVDTLQLQFEYFSFRWMNCLLLRELTETQSLRLLDAYLSDEERRWSVTHVYVCAALLLRWSPQLLSFGDNYISALKFLQSPPTELMSVRDFQDVLSESFVLQNLYEASLSRLAPKSN